MIDQTVRKNLFIRLLFGVFRGCIIGIVGGSLSAIIGGLTYWSLFQIFYHEGHVILLDVAELISGSIMGIGIPLGLLISITTGVSIAAFRISNIRSFVWTAMACLATVSGLWLSHYMDLFEFVPKVAFYLDIAIISLITGWLAHKYALPKLKFANTDFRREFVVFSSIICMLLIFITTYYYFTLLVALRNIRL